MFFDIVYKCFYFLWPGLVFKIRNMKNVDLILILASQVDTLNCKLLFMYMNNWDKGVAPAICPRILSTCEYWISAGAAPPDL